MASGGVVGRAVVQIVGDNTQLRASMAQSQAMLRQFGSTMNTTAARSVMPLSTRLKNLATGMDRVGVTLQSLGRTMTTYVTLPVVGLGYAATRMAMDFNKAMVRVRALSEPFWKDLGMSLGDVKDRIMALSHETAQAPVDLANALYFVGSAGLNAKQVMPVLEASAKGAAIGMGDLGDIASQLTSILNDYRETNLSAATAMDVLTTAIKRGKAEPADFAAGIGTLAPQASRMGVSFADLAAGLSVATNAGVPAARAITGLRYLLATMADPTDKAIEVLDNYGISVKQIQDGLAQPGGLLTTLQMLADKFDLTSVKGKAAWSDVIGGVRGRIVADTLVTGNLKKTADIFADVGSSMRKGAQDFEQAWQVVKGSRPFEMSQAWTDLKNAIMDLGKVIIPILVQDVIPAIQDAVEWFNNLPDSTKRIIVWTGAIAAAVGPLMLFVGTLLRLASLPIKVLSFLTGLGGGGAAAGAGAAAGIGLGAAAPGAVAGGAFSQIMWGGRSMALPVMGASQGVATAGAGLSLRAILGPAAAVATGAAIGWKMGNDAGRRSTLPGNIGQNLFQRREKGGFWDEFLFGAFDNRQLIPFRGLQSKFARGLDVAQQMRGEGRQLPFGFGLSLALSRQYGGPVMSGANAQLGRFLARAPGGVTPFTSAQAQAVTGGTAQEQRESLALVRMYNRKTDALKDYGLELDKATDFEFRSLLVEGKRKQALKVLLDGYNEIAPKLEKNNNQVRQSARQADRADREQRQWAGAMRDTGKAADGVADGVKHTGDAAQTSKGKVDGYKTSLQNIPDHITTQLAVNTVEASRAMSHFIATWQGKVVNVRIGVTTPSELGGVGTGGTGHHGIGGPGSGQGHAGGPDGAMGAITRYGSQMGSIVRGPRYHLVGEGRYSTFAGRGAEAILPLDNRGIGILSEAMRRAGGRGAVNVYVQGKVERPEDLDRELRWLSASRGL